MICTPLGNKHAEPGVGRRECIEDAFPDEGAASDRCGTSLGFRHTRSA